MIAPRPTLTYTQALNSFFGGMKGLAKMPLPFVCKCGENYYMQGGKDELGKRQKVQKPIMGVTELFKHISRSHRIKLIK